MPSSISNKTLVTKSLSMKMYIVILFGFLFSSCLGGQDQTTQNGLIDLPNHLTLQQAEIIFEHTQSFPSGTQLAIALIDSGQVSFTGIKRINDTIQFAENSQNIFEIGSITKVFTSTLLASLVQEGQLQLKDSIQSYLDFDIKTDKKTSFQQLANHTSGLPRLPSNMNIFTTDPNNPYKNYDTQKLRAYLTEKIKIKHAPGTQYGYSNLGVGILGFVLATYSGQSYEDLLQKRIFSKYGMLHSTTERAKVVDDLIQGLNPNGKITSNWDLGALAGAGAILSSVSDLSKFALAQFDTQNEALILTQQPTFTINDNMKIGLGWHLLKAKNGNKLIWHNGGTGGYTSSMTLDVISQNGVIILSNVSAFHKKMGNIDKLCFGLVNMLNEE